MLERKDYSAVDMVFPAIAAFIDRAAEYLDETMLRTVHTIYSALVNYLVFKPFIWIHQSVYSYNLNTSTQKLKVVTKKIFGNLEGLNEFIQAFQRLDHVAEEDDKFGLLTISCLFRVETFQFYYQTIYGDVSNKGKKNCGCGC